MVFPWNFFCITQPAMSSASSSATAHVTADRIGDGDRVGDVDRLADGRLAPQGRLGTGSRVGSVYRWEPPPCDRCGENLSCEPCSHLPEEGAVGGQPWWERGEEEALDEPQAVENQVRWDEGMLERSIESAQYLHGLPPALAFSDMLLEFVNFLGMIGSPDGALNLWCVK